MSLTNGTPDDSLLCLCKVRFTEEDEEGYMLACDGCDNWYHPSCIGMSEEEVERLDIYICAQCAQGTEQQTTYKRLCKRAACKNAVLHLDKYCSSSCAFHHMAEQIPHDASAKLLKQLAPFAGLERPKTTTTRRYAGARMVEGSTDWRGQLEVVEAALVEVEERQRKLEQAVKHWEESPAVVVRALKKGRGGEDKMCGWERDGEVCATPRRRCDRHQGWQKTMQVSLELERSQLLRQKGVLLRTLNEKEEAEEEKRTMSGLQEVVKGVLQRG